VSHRLHQRKQTPGLTHLHPPAAASRPFGYCPRTTGDSNQFRQRRPGRRMAVARRMHAAGHSHGICLRRVLIAAPYGDRPAEHFSRYPVTPAELCDVSGRPAPVIPGRSVTWTEQVQSPGSAPSPENCPGIRHPVSRPERALRHKSFDLNCHTSAWIS